MSAFAREHMIPRTSVFVKKLIQYGIISNNKEKKEDWKYPYQKHTIPVINTCMGSYCAHQRNDNNNIHRIYDAVDLFEYKAYHVKKYRFQIKITKNISIYYNNVEYQRNHGSSNVSITSSRFTVDIKSLFRRQKCCIFGWS